MSWYSGEVQASAYIRARLVVDEQRIGNNLSRITARLEYRRTNNYGGATLQYGNGCAFRIYIDGQEFVFNQTASSYVSIPAYNTNWLTFATATKDITHTSAKTITCSWSSSNMGAYLSSSGSMSCTLAAFITQVSTIAVSAVANSNSNYARCIWMNQSGRQVYVACEEIDDSGNYISTIHQWTNQAETAGQITDKTYSLTAAERQKYDNLGRNRIRWTIKTVSDGTVYFYDTHDFDYNRASTPSMTSFTVGDVATLRTNRQRSNMTHTATISIGSVVIKTLTSVGSSTTWNTAFDDSAIYAQATQDSSVDLIITLSTYIGSTLIGQRSATVRAALRTSELAPTFTDFSYKDINSTTTAVTGNDQYLIKGQSQLQASISAAQKMITKESATGKSYTFTLGNVSVSRNYSSNSTVSADLGKPTEAGIQRLTVKAFDSRSISTQVVKDITVIDYALPTLVAEIKRANDFEERTTVKFSGNFSLIKVAGVTKNSIVSIKSRHKKANESTWSNWETYSCTTSEKNGNGVVSGPSAGILYDLDNESAWNFEFQISDKLNTVTITGTVSVGIPLISINESGQVGINCIPNGSEKGVFLKEGDHVFKQIYPVDTIYESTKNTNPSAYFGGSWTQIGTRTVGSYTVYSFRRTY